MKTNANRMKIRWSHTAGMAYKENYFNLEPLDFNIESEVLDPLIIESKYNKEYEDVFPEYWNKLKSDTPELSVNDKYTIAKIIYHLKIRTQFTRHFFFNKDASKVLVEDSSDDVLQTLWMEQQDLYTNYGLDFQEYADLMRRLINVNYVEKDKSTLHNNFLHSLSSNRDSAIKKQALWRLVQSPWTILHANNETTFITTDNPGASEYNKEIFNFFGESKSKFDFYFPICSDKVLKIECRNKKIGLNDLYALSHENLDRSEINKVNLYFSINAAEELYGSDDKALIQTKYDLIDGTKYIRKNTTLMDLLKKNKN